MLGDDSERRGSNGGCCDFCTCGPAFPFLFPSLPFCPLPPSALCQVKMLQTVLAAALLMSIKEQVYDTTRRLMLNSAVAAAKAAAK